MSISSATRCRTLSIRLHGAVGIAPAYAYAQIAAGGDNSYYSESGLFSSESSVSAPLFAIPPKLKE